MLASGLYRLAGSVQTNPRIEVSHASASLLLVVLMFGLAVYFLFAPPPGFEEGILYRLILPFLLV